MNEAKILIKNFFANDKDKIQLPFSLFNGIDIEILVENMNAFYQHNLNDLIDKNKDFYLRRGYSIQTDEDIVWIGKINKI